MLSMIRKLIFHTLVSFMVFLIAKAEILNLKIVEFTMRGYVIVPSGHKLRHLDIGQKRVKTIKKKFQSVGKSLDKPDQ